MRIIGRYVTFEYTCYAVVNMVGEAVTPRSPQARNANVHLIHNRPGIYESEHSTMRETKESCVYQCIQPRAGPRSHALCCD